MDSSMSRAMTRVLDPIHTMVYFAAEPKEEYEALGLTGPAELYFPSRAAPLGQVPWQVVQATFFGFAPLAVQFGMAEAWTKTTPADVWAARLRGVDRTLQRVAGKHLADVGGALDLARDAAAACRPEGRPLFAATATMAEPTAPHMALWHQLTLLREYRGDGHLIALGAAGIDAPQSLVLNGAFNGPTMTGFLQQTRAWSAEEWSAASGQLAERGWLDSDGGLTEAGRTAREAIEQQTDALSLAPWQRLGDERCARLRELLTPLSQAVLDGGVLPATSGKP